MFFFLLIKRKIRFNMKGSSVWKYWSVLHGARKWFSPSDSIQVKSVASCKTVLDSGFQVLNRPFYRYGGHIELIRFKEYYRMPRGHEHISFAFSSASRDIFFSKFSWNKIVMGKKIFVPCFDVYNDRPFPEKYTVKDYISNTELEKGDHHYYIQTRPRIFFPIARKL